MATGLSGNVQMIQTHKPNNRWISITTSILIRFYSLSLSVCVIKAFNYIELSSQISSFGWLNNRWDGNEYTGCVWLQMAR